MISGTRICMGFPTNVPTTTQLPVSHERTSGTWPWVRDRETTFRFATRAPWRALWAFACGRLARAPRPRGALQRCLQRGMRCGYRGVDRPRPRGRPPYNLARAPPIQKIYMRSNPLRPARAPRLQRCHSGVYAEARAGASATVGGLSGVCAGGPARAGVSSGGGILETMGSRRGIHTDLDGRRETHGG